MHMENRRKFNIPMCAALVVLCLVLFSLNMTSGLLARYTTRGTMNGQARTARFNTLAERGDINGTIAFTQAEEKFDSTNNLYTVKVTNKSETAVRYTIEMVFPKGTLGYLTVNHVDAAGQETTPEQLSAVAFVNADDVNRKNDIAVYEGKAIDPNAGANPVLDNFKFDVNVAKFYEQFTGSQTMSTGLIDIDFDTFVKFVQVD